MFKYFKNKEIEKLRKDKYSRKVYKYLITLHLSDSSVVKFKTKWLRLDRYVNGIDSYKELIYSKSTITIDGITYSIKYITKIEDEFLEESYVKPECLAKYSNSGTISPRTMAISFDDDEIEFE